MPGTGEDGRGGRRRRSRQSRDRRRPRVAVPPRTLRPRRSRPRRRRRWRRCAARARTWWLGGRCSLRACACSAGRCASRELVEYRRREGAVWRRVPEVSVCDGPVDNDSGCAEARLLQMPRPGATRPRGTSRACGGQCDIYKKLPLQGGFRRHRHRRAVSSTRSFIRSPRPVRTALTRDPLAPWTSVAIRPCGHRPTPT